MKIIVIIIIIIIFIQAITFTSTCKFIKNIEENKVKQQWGAQESIKVKKITIAKRRMSP